MLSCNVCEHRHFPSFGSQRTPLSTEAMPICPMGYDDLRDNQRRADRTGAGGSMLSEW
jgi:hypothetical protein